MIETERLVLRQFQESDAEDVFEYLHQPAVHCFYNMKLDSLEDAKAEMKKWAGILKKMGYTVKSIGGISGYKGEVER